MKYSDFHTADDNGQTSTTSLLEALIQKAIDAGSDDGGIDHPTEEKSDLSSLFMREMESRRSSWFNSLEIAIQRYGDPAGAIGIANLSQREDLVSLIALTTEIALKNHQKEKLLALQHLFESYLKGCPEDDGIHRRFAHIIDRCSLWHLRILALLADPKQWAATKGAELPEWSFGNSASLIEYAYPEMEGRRELYDAIVRDLCHEGLLSTDNIHKVVPFTDLFNSLTTPMGNLFIEMTALHKAI